jgi:hypothetical protein
MAKPLIITHQGTSVDLSLEKVDRAKLYGYAETVVQDDAGKPCELGTLASDGHSVVGKGGAALVYLSHDGQWRSKAELKPVDLDGKLIVPVKSSFDAPVELEKTATIDELLSHNVHSIYHLTAESWPASLTKALAAGTIFSFPFSYRGGIEASSGFLLQGADGNSFLLVGTPTAFDFVGLQATAAVVADESVDVVEDDALDFSLV